MQCKPFSKYAIHSIFIESPPGRGRGRGRGRGANYVPISGGRKKIMSKREQRRKEDVENALKMKTERERNNQLDQSLTN